MLTFLMAVAGAGLVLVGWSKIDWPGQKLSGIPIWDTSTAMVLSGLGLLVWSAFL